jgi:hypothetical protein
MLLNKVISMIRSKTQRLAGELVGLIKNTSYSKDNSSRKRRVLRF